MAVINRMMSFRQLCFVALLFVAGVFFKTAYCFYISEEYAVKAFDVEPFQRETFDRVAVDIENHFESVECVGYSANGVICILDSKGKFGFPRRQVVFYARQALVNEGLMRSKKSQSSDLRERRVKSQYSTLRTNSTPPGAQRAETALKKPTRNPSPTSTPPSTP